MSTLSISKVPFLYNFSPAVVPKPLDWQDDITITGYWNLENSDEDWSPPDSLVAFMDKAKADGRPLVYIGFGSIVVPKPNAMTRSIISAVEKGGHSTAQFFADDAANVRAIIAKGWSSRGADPAEEGGEVAFPESCYGLEKVPHGWLFPKGKGSFGILELIRSRCRNAPWRCWYGRSKSTSGNSDIDQTLVWRSILLVGRSSLERDSS
jgi:sterol 3beta-glucosyltransferase